MRFTQRKCNRKIVGARFFGKGHKLVLAFKGIFREINDTVEFYSPRTSMGEEKKLGRNTRTRQPR